MRTMSGTGRHSIGLAGFALAMLICGTAYSSGGPSAEPPKTITAEASAHFDAGIAARDAGDWEKAREEFATAWASSRYPRIAAMLGQAELQLGRCREAVDHLSYFLREESDASREDRALIAQLLGEARAKVGTLRISVDEAGAEVLVDGLVVGTAPLAAEVLVDPGKRTIEARKPGFSFAPQTLEIAAGNAPREVRIEVEKPVVVLPREPPRLEQKQEERALRWRPWAIVGGTVLAGAGIGVGVWMTLRANGLSDDAQRQRESLIAKYDVPQAPGMNARTIKICEEDPGGCEDVFSTRRRQDTAENLAKAGYIVGGVAAVATLAVALWPQKPEQKAGLKVSPMLGGGVGGLWMGGAF